MNQIIVAPKYSSIINRQNGNLTSKQPRFGRVSPDRFVTSLLRFINSDIQNEPAYGSQQRDEWLRRVWPQEPYLAGVINSVVSIDKNRGWTITGGRNQVKRFVNILHNRFFFAPDLSGWRMAFGGSALSYYTSDIGSITEVGRDGQGGPVDSLYFTDPARCRLTGDQDAPLKYRPSSGGKEQSWLYNDYFRVVSLPNTNEEGYGLGLCALSRAIELAKIMVGIYRYDNEMLLNKAPRGVMLLKGMSQEQWAQALTAREARLEGNEYQAYGAVEVIASNDPGNELEAQLVSLSSLPAEFDQRTFTDLLMYGYSVIFGYDPREFWPVSAGALGTATETETQHRKAGGKGGLDFVLGFAEELQRDDMLPNTVLFEFEERDLDGELANAEAEQAKADVVTSIYESGLREGAPLLTPEQARVMLAERQLIDPEWTEEQEETVATDTEDDTTRALANERVQRAIWAFPDEPIVKYHFSVGNGREKHQYQTLLNPVQMSRMRKFYSYGRMVKRQATISPELTDYQDQINDLAQQANDGEIEQDEFEDQLEALTIAILTLALVRGAEFAGDASTALEDAALLILEGGEGTDAALDILTDADLLSMYPDDALSVLDGSINGSLQSTLGQDIYGGQYADNAQGLLSRLGMWGITAAGIYTYGRLVGHPEQYFTWQLGGTINHCEDCARLHNQVHTGDEWRQSGWWPRSPILACTGRRCECRIVDAEGPSVGSF